MPRELGEAMGMGNKGGGIGNDNFPRSTFRARSVSNRQHEMLPSEFSERDSWNCFEWQGTKTLPQRWQSC